MPYIANSHYVLGPPGPTAGGISYIRWGRTECPNTEGTVLVYSGVAAGPHYQHTGGGSQYLCLPDAPEFLETTLGVQFFRSYLHGTEYQLQDSPPALGNLFDHNVPCAVCYTAVRGEKVMIPAKANCTATWTREYYGYLMTEHHDNIVNDRHRMTYECVDVDAEAVPGSVANNNGALFYFTESTCNGIDCPPTLMARSYHVWCALSELLIAT